MDYSPAPTIGLSLLGVLAIACIIGLSIALFKKITKPRGHNQTSSSVSPVIIGLGLILGIILFRVGFHAVAEINRGTVVPGRLFVADPYLHHHQEISRPWNIGKNISYPGKQVYQQPTNSYVTTHRAKSWSFIFPIFILGVIVLFFFFFFFFFKLHKKPLIGILSIILGLFFLSIFTMGFALKSTAVVVHAYNQSQPQEVPKSTVEQMPKFQPPLVENIQLVDSGSIEERLEKKAESIEKNAEKLAEAIEKKAAVIEKNAEKLATSVEKNVESAVENIEKKIEQIANKNKEIKAKNKAIKMKHEEIVKRQKAIINKNYDPLSQMATPAPLVAPENNTESDSNNLPKWTQFENEHLQEGEKIIVKSGLFATRDEAKQDAIDITQKLALPVASYGKPVVYMPVLLKFNKMHTEEVERKVKEHTFKVYRVYLDAELNQPAMAARIKRIEKEKFNGRAFLLAEILAGVGVFLAMAYMISTKKMKHFQNSATL